MDPTYTIERGSAVAFNDCLPKFKDSAKGRPEGDGQTVVIVCRDGGHDIS